MLCDLDPNIYRVWSWILREATQELIQALPELSRGEDIRDVPGLSEAETLLLRLSQASSNLAWKVSQWEEEGEFIPRLKRRLAYYHQRVRHWRIVNCSYAQLKINPEATWFIDPPYSNHTGRYYKHNQIDYQYLACWCKARRGQVIVCEGKEADWLPFRDLDTGRHNGMHRRLVEKIWVQG